MRGRRRSTTTGETWPGDASRPRPLRERLQRSHGPQRRKAASCGYALRRFAGVGSRPRGDRAGTFDSARQPAGDVRDSAVALRQEDRRAARSRAWACRRTAPPLDAFGFMLAQPTGSNRGGANAKLAMANEDVLAAVDGAGRARGGQRIGVSVNRVGVAAGPDDADPPNRIVAPRTVLHQWREPLARSTGTIPPRQSLSLRAWAAWAARAEAASAR